MSAPETPLFEAFPPISTEEWRARVERDLRGKPFDRLVWHPSDGLDLAPFYRRGDLEGLAHTSPVYRRGGPVQVCQPIRLADPAAARDAIADAVERGADHIGLVPRRTGWGRGIDLERPDALATVLRDIPLAGTTWHLEGGLASIPLLARLRMLAGSEATRLSVSLSYDPLAETARTGQMPGDQGVALLRSLLHDADLGSPSRLLCVDARPYHEAGASPAYELACTIGALSELLHGLSEHSVAPDEAVPSLTVFVSIGTSYFVELAKLRALRLLLGQVCEAYGTSAASLAIHAEAARRDLTIYDAHVNMLRATTAAAAAILGGADVVAVPPFDAAYREAQPLPLRMARNTPHVLQDEAHLHHVDDPAAGAYYVEVATDQLARAAWTAFQAIEREGGFAQALHAGTVQETIAQTAAGVQAAVARQRHVVLGTNRYPNADERMLEAIEPMPPALAPPADLPSVDPAAPLASVEAAHDAPLAALVAALEAAVATQDGAAQPLVPQRVAEPFEALRLATERHAQASGQPPTILLLPIGDPAMRTARASFARNVFGCAGFRIEEAGAAHTAADALATLDLEGIDVLVVCAADGDYEPAVEHLGAALAQREARPLLVVAGSPEVLPEDTLRTAGADAFIHRGQPLLDTLRTYQEWLGITGPVSRDAA